LLHFANAYFAFGGLFFLLVRANLYSYFFGFRNAFVNCAHYLFGNHLPLAASTSTACARITSGNWYANALGYFSFNLLGNSLVSGASFLLFGPNWYTYSGSVLTNFVTIFWLAYSDFDFLFLGYSLVASYLAIFPCHFAWLFTSIFARLTATKGLSIGWQHSQASNRYKSSRDLSVGVPSAL